MHKHSVQSNNALMPRYAGDLSICGLHHVHRDATLISSLMGTPLPLPIHVHVHRRGGDLTIANSKWNQPEIAFAIIAIEHRPDGYLSEDRWEGPADSLVYMYMYVVSQLFVSERYHRICVA